MFYLFILLLAILHTYLAWVRSAIGVAPFSRHWFRLPSAEGSRYLRSHEDTYIPQYVFSCVRMHARRHMRNVRVTNSSNDPVSTANTLSHDAPDNDVTIAKIATSDIEQHTVYIYAGWERPRRLVSTVTPDDYTRYRERFFLPLFFRPWRKIVSPR